MSSQWMDPAFASMAEKPREPLRDPRVAREASAASERGAPSGLKTAEVELEDLYLPRGEGEAPIAVRIYRPKAEKDSLPALLYLHGGGFFCGQLSSDERQCARYAVGAKCAVVSVGYRLAPENPFPAGLEDCYRVLEFLRVNSGKLNLQEDSIAVGGSSAGANLAAATALLARDRQGPRICFQMLLIPALDDRLATPSSLEFTDVPDFARPEAEVMWRWYLGEGDRDVSQYAAPARATDLSNLPTAYILCVGLDPLRDEGIDYARRLTEAGVAVELHLVPSIPHGYASVPTAWISERLLQEQIQVLSRGLRVAQNLG